MTFSISLALLTPFVAWLVFTVSRLVYNIFLHPLSKFPGPLAAKATGWWKTYIEVVRQDNFTDVLINLHKQYGDVIRVGPNELHFADPAAYHQIYNAVTRWDKDEALYRSFGEDQSSFGFLHYPEAKQRKDILQPLFSRRAILKMQTLVRKNMDHLVEKLAADGAAGKSSDLFFAFRCFTMDTITTFCFAQSVNATDAPGFKAPIIDAMEASGPAFILFKHFPAFRRLIFSLPPATAMKASPETAGLTQVQVILRNQVNEICDNPSLLKEQPHPIIYHSLLDPETYKGREPPSRLSLYQEAQALMFGGGDSVGNTLMVGFYHILSQPQLYASLRGEVRKAWPDLTSPPPLEALEPLPILTATIKEALRVSPGVSSPLLRVVPPQGATICSYLIPGGTIVGISGIFVHSSPTIFPEPDVFTPARWLPSSSSTTGVKDLEKHLVAFSRGPRSCLGINLAWCELYIAFATMLRVFELQVDEKKPADLRWRDCFLPFFYSDHLFAYCTPVKD